MKKLRLTLVAVIPLCAALSLWSVIAPEVESRAATVARAALLMTTVAGAFLLVGTFLPAPRPTPQPEKIPRPSAGAYLVMAVVFVPSLASIVLAKDLWPFSDYSMYSESRRREPISIITAYGVTAGGEFDLRAIRYLDPFDPFRVWLCTHAALRRGRAVEPIAQFYFELYNRRRPAHRGPAIDALRLYRETWDPSRPSARDRHLLAEARP